MKHHLKVQWQLLQNGVSAFTAYRANALLRVGVGIGWGLVSLAIIHITYAHTDSLNGWDSADAVLLSLLFLLSTEPFSIFTKGVDTVGEKIRNGTTDLYITKPLDSQYLIMFSQPHFDSLVNFISQLVPLSIAWLITSPTLNWHLLPFILYLLICANLIWTYLRMSVISLSFWFYDIDNITFVFYTLAETTRYPLSILPKILQRLFMTFIPIAFLAYIPAQVLRGVDPWLWCLYSTIAAIGMIILSKIIWYLGVRSYTSASS
jgi:ABC-2 type transport system permease protein